MKRNDNFILREIAGSSMLIPLNDSTGINGIAALNETGALIWKLLGKECGRDFILSELKERFDADEKTLADSLDSFLEDLKTHNMLLES